MELDFFYTYNLEGRTIHVEPLIEFFPEQEAVIVVNISVDDYGNVVEAKWDLDKTTGSWGTLLDTVLAAVSEVKFNTITSVNTGINYYTSDDYLSNPEPEYQKGEMTFTFFIEE